MDSSQSAEMLFLLFSACQQLCSAKPLVLCACYEERFFSTEYTSAVSVGQLSGVDVGEPIDVCHRPSPRFLEDEFARERCVLGRETFALINERCLLRIE